MSVALPAEGLPAEAADTESGTPIVSAPKLVPARTQPGRVNKRVQPFSAAELGESTNGVCGAGGKCKDEVARCQ